MRAAILIMAHHRPMHLARLVEQLDCDWIRIFIHIDAKAPIGPFLEACPNDAKVIFLQERIAVNWGGFSSVDAILSLLRAAGNDAERFDRFCLLSGSDFLIKSLDELYRGLDSTTEFIRIDRRLDGSTDSPHCQFVRHAHFRDDRKERPSEPRQLYRKIGLYHGSQWWALTAACVAHIENYVTRNPDYIDFHRNTLMADEIFFHSIVKSSPYASAISHDFEAAANLDAFFALNEHGCHYIDWNAQGVRLPKVLDESDFNYLMSSNAYFARKFGDVSERLVERIERSINIRRTPAGGAGSLLI